jgi:hypothetical protein
MTNIGIFHPSFDVHGSAVAANDRAARASMTPFDGGFGRGAAALGNSVKRFPRRAVEKRATGVLAKTPYKKSGISLCSSGLPPGIFGLAWSPNSSGEWIVNAPFTIEQFLGVFRQYNEALWPMPMLFYAVAGFLIVLATRPSTNSARWICG